MNLVFSTVLFNTPPATLRSLLHSIEQYHHYLRSLHAFGHTISVLIHDNSSFPIEFDFNVYSFPLSYYHSHSNLGYGQGHNRNYNSCQVSFDSLFVACNPDVTFSPGHIHPFFDYLAHLPNLACAAPLVRLSDGSIQYSAKQNPTFTSLLLGRFPLLCFFPFASSYLSFNQSRRRDYFSVFSVPYLSGCFLVFPSHVFASIGGFSDRYFLHLEDADIVRRAGKVGLTLHCPLGQVCHARGRGSHKSLFQQYHLVCSAFKYFRAWGLCLF